jgi:tetraacyldisaccharide-1-P 4'-kinase
MLAWCGICTVQNLLVAFCDAALASLAVLATQGFPDHAAYAEVVFIKLS